MNKTAIKNFAIWARNKLIADITYKAGLLGISEKGIKSPLPQSTQTVQFFDIGTKEPSSITGIEIQQRKKLIEEIERKAKQSDYATAYKNVIEEVAYTWFNRLIAIRFMEVNDYLPTRIRVLSSESNGKAEPDLVTHALEANLDYSAYEKDRIIQLKHENKLDELFRMLFIKQCNALYSNLPMLFEKTSDYTELLLNVSFTDKEGVVFHLVNDISEDDFNVSKEGQVEIIGWLYQYYNTEPKDETYALLKKNIKVSKERIPAATQLFTPDWIVRYMVENSLGRLWLEEHPNDELKANWKYYLDKAEQEDVVRKQLDKIREDSKNKKPKDIKVIDPAIGSGHILVYAFDVLMQIYDSYGYSQRDAAKSIIENNLYGLDIDNRAYQLAYFAVMMKARQYNRRILNGETICHVFAIQESNAINRDQLKYFGFGLSDMEKNTSLLQIRELLDSYEDAKEYGSIIAVENCNWELLRKFIKSVDLNGQLSLDSLGIDIAADLLELIINLGETMARKYDVVLSNPPYMGSSGMSGKLSDFVKQKYPNSKSDLFSVFIEKCIHYTKGGRFLAMITQQSWMYLSSFIELRRLILSQTEIINLLHLGSGTFEEISGEVVQSCSFIIRKQKNELRIPYVINLKEYSTSNSKETAYINKNAKFYNFLMQKDYAEIPDFILAYKLNLDGLNTYRTNKLISDSFEVKRGPSLPNNDQYLRKWFEVSVENVFINPNCDKNYKWQLCTRSGSKARWFEIIDEIVKIDILPNISNFESQELAGIVWPDARFGSQAISARIKDKHVAFESGVNLIQTTSRENQYLLLAFFNTYLYEDMLSNIVNGQHFSPIYIKKLPYIELSDKKIVMLVSQIIDLLETASYNIEISPYFKSFFKLDTADFLKHCNNSREIINTTIKSVIRNEKEISNIIKQLTDIDSEDDDNSIRLFIDYYDEIKHTKSFISYFVGCLFGRYSLDFEGLVFAGGRWNASKYINYKPDSDNIIPISDEEYFKDDIVERFVEFITTLFGSETTELNLNFIAKQLGGKGNNSRDVIRNYFLKNFYKDHCQQYQKRPIYWLFDSGKQNGFKALIYMHRYDENTIGNLRIDYLHRMQRIYENEIGRMQDTIENSRDAREVTAATKRKEKLIKQLQETKEYDEKIAHLALARTSIDLDDGVKVNYEKIQTDRDGKKLDVLAKI